MCEPDQKPNSALAQPASGRYAKPVTDDEVTKARYESVPKKTREDSAYCVRLWEDWASNRQKVASVEVPPTLTVGQARTEVLAESLRDGGQDQERRKVCPKLTSSYSLWNNEAFTTELWDARR